LVYTPTLKIGGWNARCWDLTKKVTSCRVSRSPDGAPASIDFHRDEVEVSFPPGCGNNGRWITNKIAITKNNEPDVLRQIEHLIAIRASSCGLAETDQAEPLIDLASYLLRLVRPTPN
jgi:hypothetical protein